jgi:hypothetical protein
MTRVYMPTTLDVLREQYQTGEFVDLEQIWAKGPDEEDEYLALMHAADASLELLDGPGRRIVIVAELVAPRVNVPTPLRDVVAYYADPVERPVDADPDEDLAWYATQEIDAILSD